MPNDLSKIIAHKTVVAGGIILGFAGGVIGYYLGAWGSILVGSILGAILGGFVGFFGAKIFFTSVLTGAFILGVMGFRIGGWEFFDICAGTGAAIGGFMGIVIENVLKQRKKKDEDRVMDSRFCR
jgi:hypothetical protein